MPRRCHLADRQRDIARNQSGSTARAKGIKAVARELERQFPTVHGRCDEHTARIALHRASFGPETLSATADGGKVKPTGMVRSPRDCCLPNSTTWKAPGTTEVENDPIVA